MKPSAGCTIAVLMLLLAGCSAELQSLDLLRMLAEKPWFGPGPHNRWDRGPSIEDIEAPERHNMINREESIYADDNASQASEKRSAVATALNAGRRRRQPTPALGKAVTPYAGVGVLNDMGSFFDVLRDNLETLVSLSPQQRATLFKEPPTVIQATNTGGGGGSGIRKLHALRPLRPTGNIRSFVEADSVYPGANHHDPGLLWTGLGR